MTLTDDQKVFRLRITGDPDGDGAREAVFELHSAEDDTFTVVHEMRTGFIARGGSSINAILQSLSDSDESKNKDIVIDGGQSQFTLEVSAQLFDAQGHRWGDTGNGGTATDATGDSAIEQMQVLTNWLRKVPVDSLPEDLAGDITGSFGPATVEFGKHHPDGDLDPLAVAIENPQLTPRPGGQVDISMTVVEIASLGDPIDSQSNSKRGHTTS
jgi:hypothetical protein